MGKLKKRFDRKFAMLVNKVMGSGLAQEENTADGSRYITPGMPKQVRELAEEGIVLLKNDGVLPLQRETEVAVFGRVQHDWFYVGYGSGGDVHAPYEVPFFEGLTNAGISYDMELKEIYDRWAKKTENEANHGYWGHWPYAHDEMPLTDDVVKTAAGKTDTAIVIIGRAAGEDRENKLEQGSFYLTDTEQDMLERVTKAFAHTILLMDCGNIIDMSFVETYDFSAILYTWQLGQESANAIGEILAGKVCPSGRLSDTIARTYQDYPSADHFGGKEYNDYAEDIYVGYRHFVTKAKEKILYPFGYGLSYTTFSIEPSMKTDHSISCVVTNTGSCAGKEVVQVYMKAPKGALDKPVLSLVGYGKTPLLSPGESAEVLVTFTDEDMASFDEKGVTGYKDAFVLEKGTYTCYVGKDCLDCKEAYSFEVAETVCVRQCMDIAAETRRERILEDMPEEIPQTGDVGIKLADVKNGTHTLESFIAQLSDVELCDLNRGEGAMGSALGTKGNAGAYGGITESLRAKGIPAIITADGPAGLRVCRYTTLLPCGTAVACTWNDELIQKTFHLVGEEAVHFGIDVNLAPGMNIHRNPLCGRNFEYFSEDPFLSGHVAAAVVKGIQSGGAVACPKHFACNNQEFNRNYNDSRVSVRALREIYLRNFEYCVKLSDPGNIMTSYNKINGVWSHYNYDLATTILRKEWGYQGNVITDWWMRKSPSPEFPETKNNAYRIRAQVDVLMPGNMAATKRKYLFDKELYQSLKDQQITRGELQRTAANVLRFAMTRL